MSIPSSNGERVSVHAASNAARLGHAAGPPYPRGPQPAPAPSPPPAPSRMARLSSWLGGGDPESPPRAVTADARRQAARRLFARIGDFLSTHDLLPTDDNFRIARCYVLGEDRHVTRTIDQAIRDMGRLDAAVVAALAARERDAPLGADHIAAMADALARRLSESECAIRQGHASTRDYETALAAEAGALRHDPGGTVARLIDLTAAAVARSQQLADRLEETRRETESLRSNLEEARRAADEDHLTGLPNRRCFDARLAALVADGQGGAPHCVAICDIDDFKGINDRHGHETGDRVLRLIASHLRRELGANVFVARHGGEEFACLFERTGPAQATDRLDSAREVLAARVLVNQATGEGIGQITFSAGVAILGASTGAAMRSADEALYLAKRRGKNRVVIATPPNSDEADG